MADAQKSQLIKAQFQRNSNLEKHLAYTSVSNNTRIQIFKQDDHEKLTQRLNKNRDGISNQDYYVTVTSDASTMRKLPSLKISART